MENKQWDTTIDKETYLHGDWSRKFLWTCEVTTSEQLNIRIENKLNELIKVNGKKL